MINFYHHNFWGKKESLAFNTDGNNIGKVCHQIIYWPLVLKTMRSQITSVVAHQGFCLGASEVIRAGVEN